MYISSFTGLLYISIEPKTTYNWHVRFHVHSASLAQVKEIRCYSNLALLHPTIDKDPFPLSLYCEGCQDVANASICWGLCWQIMLIWRMFVRTSLYMRREENQLNATEWFIALIICSTCFGYSYAHHQELETILVVLPHMVCNALVAGGRRSGSGQQLCITHNMQQ
jgi:hypothetical protein